MYGLDDLSANGLYDLFVNGLDVQSINFCPCGIYGIHELLVSVLKRLSINVRPRDVRSYVDITPESDIPGLN